MNDLATAEQLGLLKILGQKENVSIPPGLSKREASNLINELKAKPQEPRDREDNLSSSV